MALVDDIFDTLIEQISKEATDFGKDLVIDGKAIPTHIKVSIKMDGCGRKKESWFG